LHLDYKLINEWRLLAVRQLYFLSRFTENKGSISLFSVKLFLAILRIIKHATLLVLSFRYAPKHLAPFSYISPQNTLFSTIKYELTIEFLSANG